MIPYSTNELYQRFFRPTPEYFSQFTDASKTQPRHTQKYLDYSQYSPISLCSKIAGALEKLCFDAVKEEY